MKVLVCGGRDYADFYNLRNTLDTIFKEKGWTKVGKKVVLNLTQGIEYEEDYDYPTVHIISGKARGADQLAVQYAVVNFLEFTEYPANWELHGRKAGVLRNQQMLDEGKPDLVVAFPGGVGTADMVRRAKKANVEVIEV